MGNSEQGSNGRDNNVKQYRIGAFPLLIAVVVAALLLKESIDTLRDETGISGAAAKLESIENKLDSLLRLDSLSARNDSLLVRNDSIVVIFRE